MAYFPVDNLTVKGKIAIGSGVLEIRENRLLFNGLEVGSEGSSALLAGESIEASLSGPLTGNETATIQVVIDNYDEAFFYALSTSGGDASVSANIISWNLPSVELEGIRFVTVTTTEPDKTPTTAIFAVTVLKVLPINDSSVLYEDSTIPLLHSARQSYIIDGGTYLKKYATSTLPLTYDDNEAGFYYPNTTAYIDLNQIGDYISIDSKAYEVTAFTKVNDYYYVTETNPVLPATFIEATTLTHYCVSEDVNQDSTDTDFIGASSISITYEMTNCSSSGSTVDSVEFVGMVAEAGSEIYVQSNTKSGPMIANSTNAIPIPTYDWKTVGMTDFTKTSAGSLNPDNVDFSPDGFIAYVAEGGEPLKSYSLAEPFVLSTEVALLQASTVEDNVWSGGGFAFNGDETRLYTNNRSRVYYRTLSIAGDLTTISADYTLLSIPGFIDDGSTEIGTAFSPDGTKFYLAGRANIKEFTLSIPWDPESATSLYKMDTSFELAFSISPEGHYIVLAEGSYVVDQFFRIYHLSNAWDLSSAVYLGSKDVSTSYTDACDWAMVVDNGTGITFGTNSTYYTDTFHLQNGEKIGPKFMYDVDCSEITEGEVPTLAWGMSDGISFDFGNGFIRAENRVDSIMSTTPLTVESTFSDVLDGTGGRIVNTRVTFNGDSTKLTKAYAVLQKK